MIAMDVKIQITSGNRIAKGGNMLKLSLACLLIAVAALLLPGCGETSSGETVVDTDLEGMLEYVPYQVAVNHDIFFGDPRQAKELNGLEGLNTFQGAEEVIRELPEEQGMQFLNDWGTAAYFGSRWTQPDFASLTGFDLMEIDLVINGNIIPPNGFYILKGDFNETIIGQKLTEQGYTKTDYGQHSYYSIRDDYEIDIRNPLGQIVFASMNRVAVMDGFIITSPVTADITGIFDTMDGNSPSVLNNEMCRALADSLGDVLAATITIPERIIITDLAGHQESPMMFDFNIPADWGTLRGYEMAALGYRADGDERYFDIALYYADKNEAEADGKEIVKRMQSYEVGTYISDTQQLEEPMMFTDWWQPREPQVKKYGEGAVLKISCKSIGEGPRWVSSFIGGESMPFRDLLFLATEPSVYIGQNE
jgi:hypothetical protein